MNKAININKCKNAEINYTTVELVWMMKNIYIDSK